MNNNQQDISNDQVDVIYDELETTQSGRTAKGPQYLDLLIKIKLVKTEQLNSIIQVNRATIFNTSTIPREGGNWTHYFVCSDGQKSITYSQCHKSSPAKIIRKNLGART